MKSISEQQLKSLGQVSRRLIVSIVLCMSFAILWAVPLLSTAAENNQSINQNTASKLFEQYKQQVYQVRVIDLASGDKSSIGSGFVISKTGLLATNFHVVADFIIHPEKYRLEYIAHDGSTGNITLLDIDVVHDLAIGKLDVNSDQYLQLNLTESAQGHHIYSMGNPHDLGMTIIQGIYNGYVKSSRYKKILFSGSLNSGMSGGPALDQNGQVIGVNVAKGGEQLSFLVPTYYLKMLLDRVQKTDSKVGNIPSSFESSIFQALYDDQAQYYDKLLQKEWPLEDFMNLKLPKKIDDSFNCWGDSEEDKDIPYQTVYQSCRSTDSIYLSRDLKTGGIFYSFEWISSDTLNQMQFYKLLESFFYHRRLGNVREKEDSTKYSCHTNFIELNDHQWKASTCMRAYTEYRGMFDVSLVVASVDKANEGLVLKSTATGVSQGNALRFLSKFMENLHWKP